MQMYSKVLIFASLYLKVYLLEHRRKRQNANYHCSMTTVDSVIGVGGVVSAHVNVGASVRCNIYLKYIVH